MKESATLDRPQISGNTWQMPSGNRLINESTQPSNQKVLPPQTDPLASLEAQMKRFEQTHASVIEQVAQLYIFASPSVCRKFLRTYRSIPSLLVDTRTLFACHFGVKVLVRLDVVEEEGDGMLYASVLWSGSISDVVKRLESFDEAWWKLHATANTGRLVTTYELI